MNEMRPVVRPYTLPAGPARFTAAEFLAMGEAGTFDGIKLELVRGELQRVPPPGNAHGQLQAAIILMLGRLIDAARLRGETGIDLDDDTVVGPDAIVLREPVAHPGMIPASAVLLAIEIAVSTRDRDLDLKRHLYAAAGVPHYWVVDVEREVIHLFDRPEGDDYLGLSLARFGEPFEVPGVVGTITLC